MRLQIIVSTLWINIGVWTMTKICRGSASPDVSVVAEASRLADQHAHLGHGLVADKGTSSAAGLVASERFLLALLAQRVVDALSEKRASKPFLADAAGAGVLAALVLPLGVAEARVVRVSARVTRLLVQAALHSRRGTRSACNVFWTDSDIRSFLAGFRSTVGSRCVL